MRGSRTGDWRLALVVGVVVALVAPRQARAEEAIALVGGRVITLSGRALEVGTVVMRGGRVVAVAAGKVVPAGARAIDVSGKVVTPGLVVVDSPVGAADIDLEPSTRDDAISERDDDGNHAALRLADALSLRTPMIAVLRDQGVTSAVVAPWGGLVSGQAAWLDLGEGGPEQVVRASVAMVANLGNAGASAAGGSRAYAVTRLKEMLDDARAFARGARHDKSAFRPLSGSRLDLQALQGVLSGKQPLYVRASREADLRAALAVAREQKLRLVVGGGAEAWRLASELAAARVPVLVDPFENLPESFDALGSRLDNAARLAKTGVRLGFALRGENHNAPTLRQRAGVACANGLPHDEALAAASRNLAEAFGLSDHGTLAAGKIANVVVWSGDPLELSTQVERVFVHGVEQPRRSRQAELRDRYR